MKAYSLPLLCALLQGMEVFACVKGYSLDDNAQCKGKGILDISIDYDSILYHCSFFCMKLLDVDECSLNVCDQQCLNTEGSFSCSCEAGYTLNEDKVSCTG